MTVAVRYRSGATMSYHLTAYSPWEGLEIKFHGTKGELSHRHVEVHGHRDGVDERRPRPHLERAPEVERARPVAELAHRAQHCLSRRAERGRRLAPARVPELDRARIVAERLQEPVNVLARGGVHGRRTGPSVPPGVATTVAASRRSQASGRS